MVSNVAGVLLAIIEVNTMRCNLYSMVQASVLWREYTVLRVKLQGFLRKKRNSLIGLGLFLVGLCVVYITGKVS
jgi:hypothetical protein